MDYALTQTTAPAAEPVTRAELKSQLRLDTTDDDLSVSQCIAPGSHAVAAAYSLLGNTITVTGYSAIVYLDTGNCSSGTVNVKLQESNNGSTWTDVTGGAFTPVTNANDYAVQELAYTGSYTYIRAVATVATAACEFGVSVALQALTTNENTLLDRCIVTARRRMEIFTGRSFITTVWKLTTDEFPDEFIIPRPPLQTVETIKYYNTAGVQQTLNSSIYTVDIQTEPARIVAAYGQSWPAIRDIINAVEVNFTAGYGAAATAVPDDIRTAILLQAAWLFENRENIDRKGTLTVAEDLCWPYRVFTFSQKD